MGLQHPLSTSIILFFALKKRILCILLMLIKCHLIGLECKRWFAKRSLGGQSETHFTGYLIVLSNATVVLGQ